MNEKELIRKADRDQDRNHKAYLEAREAIDRARNAPYKKNVAKKMAHKMTRGEAFNKQQHKIERERWNGKTSKHDYSK